MCGGKGYGLLKGDTQHVDVKPRFLMFAVSATSYALQVGRLADGLIGLFSQAVKIVKEAVQKSRCLCLHLT